MKGDFTRNTFDAGKQFTRVLMQQGRVQLDADWNEQAAILLHYLQALAASLIGPHGGPADDLGFGVSVGANPPAGEFLIGTGKYYVGGILCENDDKQASYMNQAGYPLPENERLPFRITPQPAQYLVYLDVWERDITYIQDETIREVALGSPDTAIRAQVVKQVRALPVDSDPLDLDLSVIVKRARREQRVLLEVNIPELVKKLRPLAGAARDTLSAKITNFREALRAMDVGLRARALPAIPSTDSCTISPDARYRGAENQLYRVELHRSGPAWNQEDTTKAEATTFKWSRENGSAVFAIRKVAGKVVTLGSRGRDKRLDIAEGDWVEIVDDDYVFQNRAEPLLKVESIDRDNLLVTLNESPVSTVGQDLKKHPFLRRWDHKAGELTLDGGAALIVEGQGDEGWLTLEDGVQIQFQKPAAGITSEYRTGDYWLIPARTATGDVEWPGPRDNPDVVSPHGVQHYYAPLAKISLTNDKVNPLAATDDLRRKFSLG